MRYLVAFLILLLPSLASATTWSQIASGRFEASPGVYVAPENVRFRYVSPSWAHSTVASPYTIPSGSGQAGYFYLWWDYQTGTNRQTEMVGWGWGKTYRYRVSGSYWYIDQSTDYSTCDNGVQDPGENGVDCGGVCSNLCEPLTCSDGQLTEGEWGIDCGGVCGAQCTTYCPDGYEYLAGESGKCYAYADQDKAGNCPPTNYLDGSQPVSIEKTEAGQCVYLTNPTLGAAGLTEIPVANVPSSWQPAGYSSTLQTANYAEVDNGDGTKTVTYDSVETITAADGSITTKTTAHSNVVDSATGEIKQQNSTETVTAQSESNWSNYNFGEIKTDDKGADEFTTWGERPDWSAQEEDLSGISAALNNSRLDVISPTPVLFAGTIDFNGVPASYNVTLAPFETGFRGAGVILVAVSYFIGLLRLCRGGD